MTIPAQIELDALVAEKVMGARVTRESNTPMIQAQPGEWGNPNDIPRRVFAPYYSTDIAAAWQVVERLTTVEDGWMFKLSTHADGWRATFGIQHSAVASTAPLAICRAALAVVKCESS